MDTAEMGTGQEILAELEQIYQKYLEESQALFRKETGFLHAIRSVLGTNTIKQSAIHQKFYDGVAEQVARLTEQLEQSPDAILADRAARLLLEDPPKDQDLTRHGWLSAAQTLAVALVPYVSRQTLEELYPVYCAAHRKRDRLPKQLELIAAMERRLQQ